MKEIRFSVIIPAFNASHTIERCLSSLTRQSVKKEDYEIIIVDDGSIDGTSDIVNQFPVKYLWQTNQGPASARNKGVKEAEGEIVLFTDADCVPQHNWIEEMVKFFDNLEVTAVKGVYKTSQKSLVARFAQIEFEERFEMLKKSDGIDMVDTYSAAYRKSIFLSLGGFDPSFPVANNEDTELSYRMSQAGYKMVFNPNAIVYHLNHPDSLIKYARNKFWRGYWRMVVYKRYPYKMLKDSYTPQTLKLQVLFLFLFIICLPLTWLYSYQIFSLLIFVFFAYLFSVLPFSTLAYKIDHTIGILSPFFLCLRAASLGSGVVWGIMSFTCQFKRR
ncbi:MAG: glycosyltransferase [Thermodesulfobacteriota bacterium]|nr:glycosyltransferase [Thermodesulfobacteriota bacterium]